MAVERFVTVGETIADDNPDIKQDMYDACKEARAAGENKKLYLSPKQKLKDRIMAHLVHGLHCLIKTRLS